MGDDIFEDVKDPYPGWPGVRQDPYLLSAFDAAMSVKAPNELGKIDLKSFSFQRVLELPQNYDGDKIFELPPVTGHTTSKRNGFREGMDRRNDCFLWTRLITSDAGHGRKKMFQLSHVSCVGSLRCLNLTCSYREQHGVFNDTDWPTGIHRDHKYPVGQLVPSDGHKCRHCGFPATCVQACHAKLFFVLPSKGKSTSPSTEQAGHMSRCAIHIGSHSHPPRSSAPRHLVDLVENSVKEEFLRNPRSPPSAVRLQATASVLNKLEIGGLTLEMTEKEKHALFQGIASVAHPDKVLSMIRSIKRAAGPVAELSAIVEMRKNTIFQTVQRSLFPGQADKDSRCFVFKMPHEEENSVTPLVPLARPTVPIVDLASSDKEFQHATEVVDLASSDDIVPDLRYVRNEEPQEERILLSDSDVPISEDTEDDRPPPQVPPLNQRDDGFVT
ncbi:hypothetical protein R1sor_003608 [Riccia sorocarpa]|uniref:Uncharacterized protein n=1 Tax=Riccia sorocarpa TaxID=122646 RepID=A0ABD3H663_9MARC